MIVRDFLQVLYLNNNIITLHAKWSYYLNSGSFWKKGLKRKIDWEERGVLMLVSSGLFQKKYFTVDANG